MQVGTHLPVQPERHCAQGTKKKRNQGETGERLIKQDLNTDQQGAWPEQKLWSSSGDMWAVEDGRPYSRLHMKLNYTNFDSKSNSMSLT